MFEQLKQLLKENGDALNILKNIEADYKTLQKEIETQDAKLKEAIQKKDKYKNFTKTLKSKLGFKEGDELNEDNINLKLSLIKEDTKRTASEKEEILQKDIENLTNEINNLKKEKEIGRKEAEKEILNTKLDLEVFKSIGSINTVNQKASEIVYHELKKGAKIDENGNVYFVNEDGTPSRIDGKILTVKDKVELIKNSEEFSFLFASNAQGGSGLNNSSAEDIGGYKGVSDFARKKAEQAKKLGIVL